MDGLTSWTQLGEAFGAPVTSLRTCRSGQLLAGTGAGELFVSADDGATWTHDAALPASDLRALTCAITEGWYVAVTGDVGPLYFGQDGYQALGTGLPTEHARTLAQIILSQPPDPFRVTDLLGTDLGVFRADLDGIATPWVPASHGLSTSTVSAIAVDPSDGTVYAGTSIGLQKSTDQGLTWIPSDNGLPSHEVRGVAIDPSQPRTLYAVTSDQGAFKSSDGAGSWAPANSGLTAMDLVSIAIDPDSPSTLYAGSATLGLFKSTDGAETWSPVDNGLTNLAVTSVTVDADTLFVTTDGGGVFRSTDGGETWAASKTGLSSLKTTAFVRQGSTLFVGTEDAGAFSSADDGATWTACGAFTSALPMGAVRAFIVDPTDPGGLLVATSEGVYRTENGGATWVWSGVGVQDREALTLAASPRTSTSHAALFVGTHDSGVGRSLSGGR
jgi:photosystem II stability/assembly factor-like uncharacterized protein